MQLTLQCSRCGRILATHVVSKPEACIEVNPCMGCVQVEQERLKLPDICEQNQISGNFPPST